MPAIACQCGIFAIGRCSACNNPLCGRHGVDRHGSFVCKPCKHQLDESDVLYAQAQREADFSRQLAGELSALRDVMSADIDQTRKLLILWRFGQTPIGQEAIAERRPAILDLIGQVNASADRFPPLTIDPRTLNWQVGPRALAAWCRSNCTMKPMSFDYVVYRNTWFTQKYVVTGRTDGWVVDQNTKETTGSYDSTRSFIHTEVVMLEDGSIENVRKGRRQIQIMDTKQRRWGAAELKYVAKIVGV